MVDVFSRFAYSESVKSKKSTAVITAFKNIYQRAPGSVYLQTDRKAEFTNKSLEKWLKQLNITLFHTHKYDTKAAMLYRIATVKLHTQHVVRGDFWIPTNGSPPCWWWDYQAVTCIHDWFKVNCPTSPSLI